MQAASDKDHALGISLAIVTGLAWSVLGIVLKYALQFVDAATISWVRFVVSGTALFLIFLAFAPQRIRELRNLPWVIIWSGLGLAGNYLAYVKGVGMTTASNATVLSQLGPLILALVSVIFLKERLNGLQMLGVATALFGFFLFYKDQISFHSESGDYQVGNLWIIFGSISWVVWGFIHKQLTKKKFHPQQVNMVVFAISALALLPFSQPEALLPLNFVQWCVVVFLALNTLIAYGSLAIAMEKAPVNQVSLIISCYPLVTILLIQLMSHFQWRLIQPEPVSMTGYVGAFFVVAGVVLSVKKV